LNIVVITRPLPLRPPLNDDIKKNVIDKK
jgi:hypothetical protein